jgi:hypothetical protein
MPRSRAFLDCLPAAHEPGTVAVLDHIRTGAIGTSPNRISPGDAARILAVVGEAIASSH